MELQYKQYWTGGKKILITDWSCWIDWVDINNLNKNNDYSLFFLEKTQFSSFFKHNILSKISYKKLDKTYNSNKWLKEYYNKIIDFCTSNSIHHIIFTHTWQYWHPDFLQN